MRDGFDVVRKSGIRGGRQCWVVMAGVARPLLLHKVGSEVGRDVWLAGAGAGRGQGKEDRARRGPGAGAPAGQ